MFETKIGQLFNIKVTCTLHWNGSISDTGGQLDSCMVMRLHWMEKGDIYARNVSNTGGQLDSCMVEITLEGKYKIFII